MKNDQTQLELEIKVINNLKKQRQQVLQELHRLDLLILARETRKDKMILRLVDYFRTNPKYRKTLEVKE